MNRSIMILITAYASLNPGIKNSYATSLKRQILVDRMQLMHIDYREEVPGVSLRLIRPLSLTNTFSSIMYLFWGVPFFQFVRLKINARSSKEYI